MPNWVRNHLTITGTNEDIASTLATLRGPESDVDFNMLCLYPQKFADIDATAEREKERIDDFSADERKAFVDGGGERPKDGYNSGGYEWCVENWGTKWNADDPHVDVEDGKATITFDTAWDPPIRYIVVLAAKHPQVCLDLTYIDEMPNYRGRFKLTGEEVEIAPLYFTQTQELFDPDENDVLIARTPYEIAKRAIELLETGENENKSSAEDVLGLAAIVKQVGEHLFNNALLAMGERYDLCTGERPQMLDDVLATLRPLANAALSEADSSISEHQRSNSPKRESENI
jgi:hypothetical protein